MVMVLLAIGPKNYVRERWHLFDGFIVISSFYEMLSGEGGAMKSFRLFRIFPYVLMDGHFECTVYLGRATSSVKDYTVRIYSQA